jgi:8-oxo-dGTP diphosphatase
MKQAPVALRFAVVAVDAVVFGYVEGELCALVSPVNRPPHYVNSYGFIGGIIQAEENTDQAIARILRQKGDVTLVHTEQLYTFSRVDRDKRNRVVSVGYLGFVRPDVARLYQHENARFVPIKKLKKLAYDHDEMLEVALGRLRGKLAYTTIAQFLLPKYFTLTELQGMYEHIIGVSFDKRNFRKKILSLDVVIETGKLQHGVKNRPAALFEFKNKKQTEISLFN